MAAKRFENRWIVVTATDSIVAKTKFAYRSYASKRDAMAAEDRINAKGSFYRRAYIVDRDNPGHVILP